MREALRFTIAEHSKPLVGIRNHSSKQYLHWSLRTSRILEKGECGGGRKASSNAPSRENNMWHGPEGSRDSDGPCRHEYVLLLLRNADFQSEDWTERLRR